jgi:hypothetical protein
MPYLEEQSQFDLIKACMQNTYNVCDNCTQGIAPPTSFLCPSAELFESNNYFTGTVGSAWATSGGIAKANYVGNFGSANYFSYMVASGPMATAGMFDIVDVRGAKGAPITQMLNDASMKGGWKMGSKLGVKSAMVQDGLSRTILASEILGYPSPADPRGAWTWAGMGGAAFTTSLPPNPTTSHDLLASCLPNPMPPPTNMYNCDLVDPTMPGTAFAAARSAHSGGVVTVMVDGSTNFVADNIDPTVWKNLGTRNAGISADLPPD